MTDADRDPVRARVLLVLATLTALGPLSIDLYTPSLPAIQHELNASEALAQASITACLLGLGLGQLVWGPLSDRVGRRPVVLLGVIGWAAASALSALSTDAGVLLATRLLAGLGGAAGIAVSRSIVRDISPDPRDVSSRIGLLAMVTAIAPVVAPLIGAGIALVAGWRADFWALAAAGAAIALAFFLVVPESLPPERRRTDGAGILAPLGEALRHRELALVALALGAQAFGFYAYITSASFVVERQFGHSPGTFALVFGTSAAGMLLANTLFRRMSRRHHPARALGIGLALSVVGGAGMLTIALANGPEALLWAASIVFATGTGFVLPSAHSWGQLTSALSGAASALTGSAQFLGGVLGSPATGMLGVSAATLGAVITASSLVALGAWVVARRRRPA